jgi:hypothetical protein
MIAAQPTLSAIKDLPDVLQTFVYEFTMGTPDYRRHQFRYAYVLSELLMRLQYKRAAESKLEELDALLDGYRATGMVSAFTRTNFDLEHLTPRARRFIPAFFSQYRHVVFRPIWTGMRGPSAIGVSNMRGPSAIGVSNMRGPSGWAIVTYDFFQPLHETNGGRIGTRAMTIHGTIQDFDQALAAAQEQ